MRPRTQFPVNLKFILVGVSLAIILLFLLRSSYTSSSDQSSTTLTSSTLSADDHNTNINQNTDCSSVCNKLPQPLSHAILHYSTSTITPQQTLDEISITARILQTKSPCNFLVFGLGYDSLMWNALNYNGHTLFLEEDKSWISQINTKFPMLESRHVTYDSKVNQANHLMEEAGNSRECVGEEFIGDLRGSKCRLALTGLPTEVYETNWDLIMVDAPTGYHDEAPGRMSAIYTAGMIARGKGSGEVTDVFVHDVNREVEDKFSREFLCEGYLVKQEGRLRHFRIPGHRDGSKRPFCPSPIP